MTNNFENLGVWKKSHELVLVIYNVTKSFPAYEKFRLTDQICRSASSVCANIVEGNSRRHSKEYLQFINTAYASLEETKYHLLLSKDLGYITEIQYESFLEKATEISKMLNSLRKYLRDKS